MTDTLVSEHVDEVLYELSWETPSGAPDQWAVLSRLLSALDGQSWVFGAVSGTVRVGHGSVDAPTFEEWPIRADRNATVPSMRNDALGDLPWPIELRLDCEPLLWLPDDHINVIEYDDVDLFSYGRERVAISKVSGGAVNAHGLQPWRLHRSPVQLLALEVTFGAPRFATSMGLEVCSNCDLWRPTRLDGEPNSPHGEENAKLLAGAIAAIAAATGAQLSRGP